VAELTLFGLGLFFYLQATKPLDRKGRYALAALIGLLLLAQAASYFGPPPPSERAVAWGTLVLWLLIPWAAWIDRHRAAQAWTAS